MKKTKKSLHQNFTRMIGVTTAAAFLALTGCSGSSGSTQGAAGAINLSGVVGIPTFFFKGKTFADKSTILYTPSQMKYFRGINPASVDLSDFAMSCVTLQETPTEASDTLGTDGSFSLELPDAQESNITCSITNNGDSVATVLVVDPDSKDFDGNSQTQTSISLSGDEDMGSVDLDLEKGVAEVAISNLEKVVVDEPVPAEIFWDATGSWVISAADQVPTGYENVCEEPPTRGGGDDCHGPRDGEQIYLKQVAGKKFIPDAAVTGVTTDEDRYGLMLWRNKESLDECSASSSISKLGTTMDELKLHGVDFTGDASVVGETYSFASSVSSLGAVEDGYKFVDTAEANWDIRDCSSYTYNGLNTWRCHDSSSNNSYQFGLSGGCRTALGAPIEIQDWHNVVWGECSSATVGSGRPDEGFQVNTCSAIYNDSKSSRSVDLVCKNEFAVSAISNPTSPSDFDNELPFNYNAVDSVVARGELCSTINPMTNELDQARCYAEYFHRNVNEDNVLACLPKLRTNWNADTAEEFIGDLSKPMGRIAANFYHMNAQGTGSFHSEEEDYRGVQVGDNWINCHIREAFTVNFSPVVRDGAIVSEVLATFDSTESLLDTDKQACVDYMIQKGAVEKDLGNNVKLYAMRSKSMFKLNKVIPE